MPDAFARLLALHGGDPLGSGFGAEDHRGAGGSAQLGTGEPGDRSRPGRIHGTKETGRLLLMTAAGSRPDFVAGDGFFDIQAFLAQEQSKDLLRLTTAGSVDDGKSTLIGRMLHDARGAYEDQLKSARRGGEIDFALLTDGLRAEREQGITIDVAYRYFSTPKRTFILADTPGHVQYTRNMVTGASTSDLAVILVDASHGATEQSRRHAYIAWLLGTPHFAICVNKMDLVGYSEDAFEAIRRDFQAFLDRLAVPEVRFIPISALHGDNVVDRSTKMPWYDGPPLLEYLETVQVARDRNLVDLR